MSPADTAHPLNNIMGFCKGLVCLGLIGGAGYAAYRLGPWYDTSNNSASSDGSSTSSSAADSLLADPSTVCEGCCNGLIGNCDRPLNDVMFAMVHNAMSSRDYNFLAYNHIDSLEKSLVAGYRGLMIDSCICDGSLGEDVQNFIAGHTMDDEGTNYLGFCHTSCDAGVRDPTEVLSNIKTFLDVNRNEVILLEFEIIDNSLQQLYDAVDMSELDTYIYRRETSSSSNTAATMTTPTTTHGYYNWPTMQSLIDANTRLIIFAHGDGMESCTSSGSCPEGIFSTDSNYEQTNWNDKSCTVKGASFDTNIDFFLMNHWMNGIETDLPYKDNAEEFNTLAALSERYNLCTERKPNIVAVDFWHVGDVLDFVKQVNEQLGVSSGGGSGSSSSSEGGDGADTGTSTGGTITSDTLDYIKENSSPPTVLTADYSYIPTYTPTDVW